jgi:hypothetical protein
MWDGQYRGWEMVSAGVGGQSVWGMVIAGVGDSDYKDGDGHCWGQSLQGWLQEARDGHCREGKQGQERQAAH